MYRYIRYIIVCLSIVTLCASGKAQQIGFDFSENEKKVSIRFERYNNLIIIPLLINNVVSLKFILDTGVQYPILTEKALADFLDLNYTRRIVIESPGVSDSISALVAQGVSLKLPGGIKSGINQSLLVLEKDYLQLRKNLGADVYGIIGYSIFSRFVVEIDNDNLTLTLHEPSKYRPKKFSTKVPIKIVNTKPYVKTKVHIKDSIAADLNMLIDTGASHAMLLDASSEGIVLPNKTVNTVVGRGLGGEIKGVLGRVECFSLSKYHFKNPISSFPIDGVYGNAILRGSRNGTIGGEILTRFNMVFDYNRSMLYLKKSSGYYKSFEHDMSGINLVVHNRKKGQMLVENIREDSPAYYAGIKKGDIITELNGYTMSNANFNEIISILRQKDGKRVSARVLRDDKPIKFSFKLEKII